MSVLLTVFLLYSVSQKLNQPVDNIKIIIRKDAANKTLIHEKEVRMIIKQALGYDPRLLSIKNLDLFKLETALNANSRIDNAEVYVDKHKILRIEVKQKKPIVRIELNDSADYYLDYKGDRVPVTDTYRVPVVTGFVDEYVDSYQNKKEHNLKNVLELARKVHDDEFLTALVEQIHIDKKDNITIVPKVGRDKIIIGQADDLDEKIYKLKVYYEKGIKNIGLEKFDELDLQYKGQIVGRQKDT